MMNCNKNSKKRRKFLLCIALILGCCLDQFTRVLPRAIAGHSQFEQSSGFGTLPLDSTSVSPRRVLINVGPGSTGTHSMLKATCLLGLPSTHYNIACGRLKNDQQTHILPEDMLESLRGQSKVIACHKKTYLYDTTWEATHALQEIDVSNFLQEMENALRQTLASGKVLAFHDAPYPNYMGLVEKIHQEIYGAPPFIMISYRDPKKWMVSRFNHRELICLDGYDHIDHFGCMERALASRIDKSQPLYMADVFMWHGHLSVDVNDVTNTKMLKAADGTQHKLSDILDGSIRHAGSYFERYSNRSLCTIDLFHSPTKMDAHDIAERLAKALPRSLLENGYNAALQTEKRACMVDTRFCGRHKNKNEWKQKGRNTQSKKRKGESN